MTKKRVTRNSASLRGTTIEGADSLVPNEELKKDAYYVIFWGKQPEVGELGVVNIGGDRVLRRHSSDKGSKESFEGTVVAEIKLSL